MLVERKRDEMSLKISEYNVIILLERNCNENSLKISEYNVIMLV